MKRFKIYDLRFMIFLLLFALFINRYSLFINHTFATESTASSNLSPELKVKLDELKKEIASKAAKLKLEINLRLQNKAYVGVLKSKTDSSLTLASKTGAKIITVNQDTVYESRVKSKIKSKQQPQQRYKSIFSYLL